MKNTRGRRCLCPGSRTCQLPPNPGSQLNTQTAGLVSGAKARNSSQTPAVTEACFQNMPTPQRKVPQREEQPPPDPSSWQRSSGLWSHLIRVSGTSHLLPSAPSSAAYLSSLLHQELRGGTGCPFVWSTISVLPPRGAKPVQPGCGLEDKPLRAVLMVPLFLYLLCYLFPHASLPSPPATGLCCCVVVSSVSFCSNA